MRALFDALRIAIGAGVLLRIEPWVSESFDSPTIISFLISAVLSGVLVSFAHELVFSRPRLILEWVDPVSTQRKTGPIDLHVTTDRVLAYYQISLKGEGRSAVSRMVLRALGRSGGALAVQLSPNHALRLTSENSWEGCAVQSDEFSFDLDRVRVGTIGWLEMSLEVANAPAVAEVDLNLVHTGGSRTSRLAFRCVAFEHPVKRIRLTRSWHGNPH